MAKKRRSKNAIVAAFDGLNFWIKLLLCIPALNIAWAVYRIIKGLDKKNTLMVVVGVLWIIPGVIFAWLIDLICVLIWKRPKLVA